MEFDYPDTSKVWGMDISHWTGIVDWDKALKAGVKFVFIKATHGETQVRYFAENAKNSYGLLPRGFYHWLLPDTQVTIKRQVEALRRVLGEYQWEIPPVIDFEYSPFKGTTTKISDLQQFIDLIKTDRLIIYTGYSYWRQYGSADSYWATFPLWIANYKTTSPAIPVPWKTWKFWQWTEHGDGYMLGTAPGEISVDLNYFNGTYSEFTQFISGEMPLSVEYIRIRHNDNIYEGGKL